MRDWKFVLMMIIAVIVWACAFPFISIGLVELSFVNLTIMRFLVVCVAFFIVLILVPKKFSKLHKKDILPIFILGFFGVMVYHLGLNYGEQYISASAASLIIATIPIYVVILATIFLNEKIKIVKFLGIILALLGVVIISIWGKENVSIEVDYIFAAFAVLLAAVMGALYTIAGKKLLERYNGLSLTVYAMLLGSIGLIPFVFVSPTLIDEVTTMSTTAWFAILFLGLFSSVIGYVIWYVALEMKTASSVSVYLYAIPVLSTIISYFLLGDEITYFFVLGGVFVIFGLVLVNMKTKKLIK